MAASSFSSLAVCALLLHPVCVCECERRSLFVAFCANLIIYQELLRSATRDSEGSHITPRSYQSSSANLDHLSIISRSRQVEFRTAGFFVFFIDFFPSSLLLFKNTSVAIYFCIFFFFF